MQEKVANLQYQHEWTVLFEQHKPWLWTNLKRNNRRGQARDILFHRGTRPKRISWMRLILAQNNQSHVHCAQLCVCWQVCGCLCGTYQNTKVTNISNRQRNDRNSWTVNWCTFVMAIFAKFVSDITYPNITEQHSTTCMMTKPKILPPIICEARLRGSLLCAELLTICDYCVLPVW